MSFRGRLFTLLLWLHVRACNLLLYWSKQWLCTSQMTAIVCCHFWSAMKRSLGWDCFCFSTNKNKSLELNNNTRRRRLFCSLKRLQRTLFCTWITSTGPKRGTDSELKQLVNIININYQEKKLNIQHFQLPYGDRLLLFSVVLLLKNSDLLFLTAFHWLVENNQVN